MTESGVVLSQTPRSSSHVINRAKKGLKNFWSCRTVFLYCNRLALLPKSILTNSSQWVGSRCWYCCKGSCHIVPGKSAHSVSLGLFYSWYTTWFNINVLPGLEIISKCDMFIIKKSTEVWKENYYNMSKYIIFSRFY